MKNRYTEVLTVTMLALALGASSAGAQTASAPARAEATAAAAAASDAAMAELQAAAQAAAPSIAGWKAETAASAAEWKAETAASATFAADWKGVGDAWIAEAKVATMAAPGWAFQTDADRERQRAQRDTESANRDRERVQRDKDRESQYYDSGQNALDGSRWDRAVDNFDRVIELKGSKTDAALYWKAYAQNKLGQRPEALATITQLTRDYPKSRYLSDAKALEVEVRRDTGSPVDPKAENDEELKIMAINGLQNSAPEEAVPMLEKVLHGTGSPKIKAQALFVLAQSSSPKAREVLVNIAKGNGNPDLQMRAVRYLGLHGNAESRAALAEIYASSSDVDMKKRILQAFMTGGEKGRLLTAAQSEQNPELRATAVQQLGVMGAHEELWSLYQKESTVEVKKQIIRAMFIGGDATRLIDLAKEEQNPELRLLAVRNLGLMGNKRTGDALVEIYGTSKDLDLRKAVVNGLFIQQNAESLVALARKEQDPAMKKDLVQKLSLIHSKVATDYLLEILNK